MAYLSEHETWREELDRSRAKADLKAFRAAQPDEPVENRRRDTIMLVLALFCVASMIVWAMAGHP